MLYPWDSRPYVLLVHLRKLITYYCDIYEQKLLCVLLHIRRKWTWSVSQSVSQRASQSASKAIDQLIQLINQPVSQSISQSRSMFFSNICLWKLLLIALTTSKKIKTSLHTVQTRSKRFVLVSVQTIRSFL